MPSITDAYSNSLAYEYENEVCIADMGEEAMEMLYPEFGDSAERYNQYACRDMDAEMLDYLNTLRETVKINGCQ